VTSNKNLNEPKKDNVAVGVFYNFVTTNRFLFAIF